MVQIYPDSPLYNNTGSKAEQKVFNSLESLPADWIVIHSLRWIQKEPGSGRKAQGEGDFIIISPTLGIMVLEVKGGEISYQNRIWKTKDINGNNYIIQDPEKQASDTMHEIRKTFKRKAINAFVCHAVWFPDVDTKNANLPLHLDRKILFDMHDLDDPIKKIIGCYEFWKQRKMLHFDSLSDLDMKNIKKIFNPDIRMSKLLKMQCQDVNDIYIRLNEEQYRILEYFEECKKITITGRAGTGKTLLAVEKCRREANKTKNVLFLCFNSYLADHIQNNINGLFHVHTIHSYALHYLKSYHSGRLFKFEEHQNFDFMMDEFVEVSDFAKEEWDCITIDEGQDFSPEWIKAINNLLADDGKISVFYDPHQVLYSSNINIDHNYLNIGEKLTLKRNMRNTDEISKGTLNVIEVPYDESYLNGIKGSEVEIYVVRNKAEVKSKYESVIHRLTNMEYVNQNEITVLTVNTTDKSIIKNSDKLNNIFFSSVRKYKGLENNVIVIVDANLAYISEPTRQKLLYVAMSRAKVHVILIIYVDSQYKDYLINRFKCKDEELEENIKKKIGG